MIWNVLRPYYWMLDRKVRTTSRLVVIALILFLLFAGQWVHDNLLGDNISLLNSEHAATTAASALPMGLFLSILFALLGVGDMMHRLYLASDMELLLVAPVPHRTIFLIKLLQSCRATLIPALGFGAFLLALGLAQKASSSYYLLIVVLILATMILTTAMIMTLVILLAKLFNAQRIRSWIPAVIALATFSLMLSQRPATEWFLGRRELITFLTQALLNPARMSLVVAGIGGLALATGLLAYQIFRTSFRQGWNHFHEAPTQRISLSLTTRRPRKGHRLLQPLPLPLRPLLIKEWLQLRRNPRGLINLAQPLVLVIAVLVPFFQGENGAETMQWLIFWFMLMMVTMLLSFLPLGTSLIAIAQEGRNIGLLRSLPVSMSEVLKGKFWATWLPTVLSWGLVLLIAGIWLRFQLWQIGLLAAIVTWGLAGTSLMTMAIGGVKIDFTAEELKQRIPTFTSYLMMSVNLIFLLSTTSALVWLIIQLRPDSPDLLAIQGLSGYPLFGWIFSSNLLIPTALLGSQVVFWMAGKRLWDVAIHRMAAWEES